MWPQIPPDISVLLYVLCVGTAVLVIGIAKSGFGGGIGVVAVPLMAVAVPTDQTIGILLPVLLAADLFAVQHHRRNRSRTHLSWLISGAVIGIVGGTGVLILLRQTESFNAWLNVIIGLLCLTFVLLQCYRLMGGRVARISPHAHAGRIAGFIAGFVSTLTHAAGPVISIYLLEQRLAKRLLVGTAVVFAFAGNLLKLPTYFGLQLINPATLVQSLWCLPLVPVGAIIGIWMHKRINEKAFTVVMYTGAAAAAGHMLYRAWT